MGSQDISNALKANLIILGQATPRLAYLQHWEWLWLRDRQGENFKVAAIIGDGALTGGMALEAINHAGHLPNTNPTGGSQRQ